jgi:hypothetical protein
MNVLAKNAGAIQIFGQGIVKTTLDLERMGISIQSMMRQSESYVTNLDGAIDSIAQLNQLGVQLDFGELTRLQEFDPAAAQQYIANNISAQQLQSSSFRALLGSIPGVNIEEILKLKNVRTGLESLEGGTTKQAEAAGAAATGLAATALQAKALGASFVTTAAAAAGAAASLINLGITARNVGALLRTPPTTPPTVPPTGPTTPSTPSPGGTPPAPVAASRGATLMRGAGSALKTGAKAGAIGGLISAGTTLAAGGDTEDAVGQAVGTVGGAAAGTAIGQGVGVAISMIPVLTPFAPGIVSGTGWLGGMIGGYYGSKKAAEMTMDDGISLPGYGDRTLVTTNGSYDINNNDTVVSGTKLFNKDSLQFGDNNSSVDTLSVNRLIQKVDSLIAALNAAETTVVVNNTVQQRVNRTGLVSILTRNEGA